MRRYSTIAGLFLVVLVFLVTSCFKDGLLNLTNGLSFSVNAKLLPAPISVSFVNADPGITHIPENIYLDFFGEGAHNLFTPTGSNNLVVVEGLVYIGIKDKVVPTANKPLKFGMEVESPGFYPAIYFVSLNNPDNSAIHNGLYGRKGDVASGVSDKKEFHEIASTGFTSSQNLETPLNHGKHRKG